MSYLAVRKITLAIATHILPGTGVRARVLGIAEEEWNLLRLRGPVISVSNEDNKQTKGCEKSQ